MSVYGSDRLVGVLSELGAVNLALNPGATIRGLHDSLVNPVAAAPQLINCLHEEVAVGFAHGYAKASGAPMAVGLHDTVGLLHASMALFNAWVDRVPMLVLVGTGPLDTTQRRPWIDWIHTVGEQGELVRRFTTWNDQPASLPALVSSVRRGWRASISDPPGPALIAVDVLLQEQPSTGDEGGPLPAELLKRSRVGPDPLLVEEVLARAHASRAPVVITDRPLSIAASAALTAFAERIGAALLDLGGGAAYPVGHPNDVTESAVQALDLADLLIYIDVRDPALAFGEIDLTSRRMSGASRDVAAISIGLVELGPRAWLVPESDQPDRLTLVADPELALDALVRGWGPKKRSLDQRFADMAARPAPTPDRSPHGLSTAAMAHGVASALKGEDVVVANGDLRGWTRRAFRFQAADQFLGKSGGEGLGYGAPASIGAALALRGSGRIVVDMQGDGDLLYVPQSLWTAAHHRIPLLMVVDANRRYEQDRRHQAAIAKMRQRPAENVGVGIDIAGPDVDFCGLARSLGVVAEGPVSTPEELEPAIRRAADRVKGGEPVLVEVVTAGRGG